MRLHEPKSLLVGQDMSTISCIQVQQPRRTIRTARNDLMSLRRIRNAECPDIVDDNGDGTRVVPISWDSSQLAFVHSHSHPPTPLSPRVDSSEQALQMAFNVLSCRVIRGKETMRTTDVFTARSQVKACYNLFCSTHRVWIARVACYVTPRLISTTSCNEN